MGVGSQIIYSLINVLYFVQHLKDTILSIDNRFIALIQRGIVLIKKLLRQIYVHYCRFTFVGYISEILCNIYATSAANRYIGTMWGQKGASTHQDPIYPLEALVDYVLLYN